MRPTILQRKNNFVRIPCARCGRPSAFVGEGRLCPFCRGADIEVANGLRPGIFRELVLGPASAGARPGQRSGWRRRGGRKRVAVS